MPIVRCSKRALVPRRPYDRQRLINDMKYLGEYGLKCKREVRIMEKVCDKIKKRARDLLIHTDEDYQIVQGRSLLNRLEKQGITGEFDSTSRGSIITGLEKILDITIVDFLNRRLQTRVFSMGLAKSIHHARVLIQQKHIAIKGFVVDKPGFLVTSENDGFITIAPNSTLNGDRPGRSKKKKMKASAEE